MYYKHIHSYLFTLRSVLLTLCYYLHLVERFLSYFGAPSELLTLQLEILTLGWAARIEFVPLMDGDPTSCWWTMGIIRGCFFFFFFRASDGFHADQYWSVVRHLCWRLDLVFPWKYCRIIISPLSLSLALETRWSLVWTRSWSLDAVLVGSFPCNRGY